MTTCELSPNEAAAEGRKFVLIPEDGDHSRSIFAAPSKRRSRVKVSARPPSLLGNACGCT